MVDSISTAFILRANKMGQILRVYWHQPIYLVSPFQKNVADLFIPDHEALIKDMLERAFQEKEAMFCQRALTIRSPEAQVSACFMASNDSVLITGLDLISLHIEHAEPVIKDMIFQMFKLIQGEDETLITDDERLARAQFEKIQKLNNDLLNMQRQLRKANAKLKQLNDDLNNRLVKDELTGLVSRYQYRTEIDMRIKAQPEKKGIFTFIDIDQFKQVNDQHGHRTGDVYLKSFARRLQALPFPDKICMRISGDEFGLYIHGYEQVLPEDISAIWQEIRRHVTGQPIEADGLKLSIFCSAGMAVYGEDTTEIYDLIEYADFAMYQAKRSGKNAYHRFSHEQYLTGTEHD